MWIEACYSQVPHFRRRAVYGLLLPIALFLCPGCEKKSQSDAGRTKVSIGIQVSPAMTLLMVAKEKGFFAKRGLDVELKQFTAGKFALQAFFAGSLDFAVSGEVPVCLAVLAGNRVRVVTQVVEKTIDEVRIVARKDSTYSPSDPASFFKGRKRRLATSFGGGPEFFTYNFLKQYDISPRQVELLSQRPEDMPASLASKSVDAISIFDPFAYIAEKQLNRDAVTFRASDLYSELYVLVAHPNQADRDAATVTAVLSAMQQAAAFTAANPEEAKQILAGYTQLDRDIIDGIWPNFSFKLAITPQLLSDWNAEARWAKATGKVTPQTSIPNFSESLDPHYLENLDAGAVKLQ
jgi:ABC-type nitrate/sulfonate/bicarbonate transport system substrate-binding protein